jgi:hypothetical protein
MTVVGTYGHDMSASAVESGAAIVVVEDSSFLVRIRQLES